MLYCNIMIKCHCRFVTTTFLVLNEVVFFGVFCYVTEPIIKDSSYGHTTIGEDINLECTVTTSNSNSSIEWWAPINLNLTKDRVNIITVTKKITPWKYVINSSYTISNSKIGDSSVYYCRSTDGQNPFDSQYKYIWIPVYDKDEHVLNFYPQLVFFDRSNLQLKVYVQGHPETTFHWIDNNNKTISEESEKFTANTTSSTRFANYKSVLTFNKLEYEDFGNYTIVAENKYERKTFSILVNVTGRPYVGLKIVSLENDFSIIESQSVAFPKPNITWEFQECDGLSCFQDGTGNFFSKNREVKFKDNGLQTSSLTAVYKSGLLRSVSSNMFGTNSSIQHIYKINDSFQIIAKDMLVTSNLTLLEALHNELVEIMCAVTLHDYHHQIRWFRTARNFSLDDPRVPIKGFAEYQIRNFNAIYTSVSILKFNVDQSNGSDYYCKATTKDGKIMSKMVRIVTRELPYLNVISNMHNSTVSVRYGKSSMLYCNVNGYPTPWVEWYKNNVTIVQTDRIQIRYKNQALSIDKIRPSDNGIYVCKVSNRIKQIIIKTTVLGATDYNFDWLIVTIIIIVIIIAGVKAHKDKKLRNELKAMGLAYFEEGLVGNINPEMRLNDQVEYLPYDRKWEIPVENLKLGEKLGSGAFGVVVKGELSSIPVQNQTTVAVKMVNKLAGHDCIKALASELKIMVHLGQHVNIVNLIGACTKDVTKKKLLVVVEFCGLGSIHEHIVKHSKAFVDQRREDKNGFDWTIGPHDDFKSNRQSLQYATLSFSSADSSNPDCEKPNYKNKNYEESENKYISTHDFVAWAFQISKGMEYLASRKVLHGDLAARNVLLTEDNVVKISDFGLARSMYKNGIYKKTAYEPLPAKWLAIESIRENIFSTQSDVWSFGIVLWELFSLGTTPYPGIPADQNLYTSLFSGYRMEMPEYATREIYEMMLECWDASPMKRPTFTKLAEKLGLLLEPPVKDHYLEINSGYSSITHQNAQNCDYLSMMSPPDFANIVLDKPSTDAHNLNYFRQIKLPKLC